MVTFKVSENCAHQTIEKFVKKVLTNASLGLIYKLFRKKDVKVNGHWVDAKYILNVGDEITIYITDSQLEQFKHISEIKNIDEVSKMIVYEDENIILINKPRGLLVTKDNSNEKCLSEMVLSYLKSKNEYDPSADIGFTPGPAHRLDRNTSGMIIFGKNIATLQYLFELLKDKKLITKKYIALVNGQILKDGQILAPLKKDTKTLTSKVTSLKDGGKESITLYHVLKKYKDYTLIEATLITGRTHQIRVHMSYIGHPIVGDRKYGDFEVNKAFEKEYNFTFQFLHSYEIIFGKLNEPLKYLSNKSYKAELNNEYLQILEKLNNI